MATPRKRPEDKLKVGRHSIYSQEISDKICEMIATCPYGLKRICEENPKLPDQKTINTWLWKHPEFLLRYDAARQHQAILIFQECDDIACAREEYIDAQGNTRVDTGAVARHRHMTETKRWMIGRLSPKRYSDEKKLDIVANQGEEILAEVKKVQAGLNKASKKDY